MCVDYTNLKKACPKDPFELPRIDQVVDSTAGCELLCFLDAYSGYHQVSLAKSDCIKTSFITPFGAYCYITMPFGLKNACEPISEPRKGACMISSGATWKHTSTTSSSSLGLRRTSYTTYQRHSQT